MNISLHRQSQPQKVGFFVVKNMQKVDKKLLLTKRSSIQFEEFLCGQKFVFKTKPGLFSKDKVDEGTKLLVENTRFNSKDIVADLGCGYGTIGLVASTKVFQGKVYMVDSDIRAVTYAKLNADLNNISRIEIRISDGFHNLQGLKFDVVLSNPPSHGSNQLLEEFISGSYEHLKEKGKIYLVTELRLLPLIKRILIHYFGNYHRIAMVKNHVVSLAIKKNA